MVFNIGQGRVIFIGLFLTLGSSFHGALLFILLELPFFIVVLLVGLEIANVTDFPKLVDIVSSSFIRNNRVVEGSPKSG